MRTDRRKYVLKDVWYPQDLTLTKARKYVSERSLQSLGIGQAILYRGVGHPTNFTVQRVK